MVNAEFEFRSLDSRSRLTISDSGIDGDRIELIDFSVIMETL